MAQSLNATSNGLDGVVVAATGLSDVDGERGRLIVCGHDIETLVGAQPFEAVVRLLETGELPDASQVARVRDELGRARVWAFEQLPRLGDALSLPDGMEALRASLAHLSSEGEVQGLPVPRRIVGATAVFAAAWVRLRSGLAPVPPDPARPHAEDYWRMQSSQGPSAATQSSVEAAEPARAEALQAYLVTVCDHGMSASTFAARVIASTGSDTVSAVIGALGALKGPLHGGAPGPVLDMLDAIGTPERAIEWLEGELGHGRRIMGMGHRVYRVRDPRAAVLEHTLERLERSGARSLRLSLARAVERGAESVLRARHPERALRANVEFYTAVLLDAVGIPRSAFTPTFTVGRVAGWLAHIREQRAHGRLIRPSSTYVGAIP